MRLIAKGKFHYAYLLSFLLLLSLFGSLIYCCSNVIIFDATDPTRAFTWPEFYYAFTVVFLIELAVWILGRKAFKIKIHPGFFILFLILFLSTAILPWLFSEFTFNGVVYKIALADKLQGTFMALMIAFGLYELFVYAPKMFYKASFFRLVAWATIIICSIAVIYSLATEMDSYLALLDMANGKGYSPIQSYTGNPNIYAFMLWFGIAACMFLEVKKPAWYLWLFVLVFQISEFFVLSRGMIVLSVFFTILYFFYQVFHCFKGHKLRSFLFLLVGLGVIVFFACFNLYKDIEGLNAVYALINRAFQEIGNNPGGAFDVRFSLWGGAFDAVKSSPLTLMMGLGLVTWQQVLGFVMNGSVTDVPPMDSTWVASWARGGLVDLVISIILIIIVFRTIARALNEKDPLAFPALLMFIIFFIRSFFENEALTYPSTSFIILLCFTYLPLQVERQENRRVEERILEEKGVASSLEFDLAHHKRSRILPKISLAMVPLFTSLLALIPLISGWANLPMMLGPYALSCMFVVGFLTPVLFSFVVEAYYRGFKFLTFVIALLVAAFMIFGLASPFIFDVESWSIIITVEIFVLISINALLMRLSSTLKTSFLYLLRHVVPNFLIVMGWFIVYHYYPVYNIFAVLAIVFSVIFLNIILHFFFTKFDGTSVTWNGLEERFYMMMVKWDSKIELRYLTRVKNIKHA